MNQPFLFELPEEREPPKDAEVTQPGTKGRPRVQLPQRQQVVYRPLALDQMLPQDDVARVLWDFVCDFGGDRLYESIRAVEHAPGRPPIDPRILVTLWLLATIKGVGSAREIDRLCKEHLSYMWICGEVSVNYHTLADFRANSGPLLDQLLTDQLVCLMAAGVVQLERVSQDGMRVRANAGSSSFRRGPRLEEFRAEAEEHLAALRNELASDPAAPTRRQAAARERAARERVEQVGAALAAQQEVKRQREERGRDSKPEEARGSTTDPEARVMKMADGGSRPAFNVQLATDNATQVIVGVDVLNLGCDSGQLAPMVEQIEDRTERRPSAMLVDGGFVNGDMIGTLELAGTKVYAPIKEAKKIQAAGGNPFARRKTDSAAVAGWRERMGTAAAKEIYKERAATAECVNALARNRGLRQFPVRGLTKARTVALWYVIAHNVLRMALLRAKRKTNDDREAK